MGIRKIEIFSFIVCLLLVSFRPDYTGWPLKAAAKMENNFLTAKTC